MPLNDQQQKKFDEWNRQPENSGKSGCPNCHNTQFTKPELVRFLLANPFEKDKHQTGAYLMQTCTLCKYVTFIDAKEIGVVS